MANIAIDLAYITTVKAGIAYYIDNLLKYIFKIDKENSYHLFSYKKPELDFMKNIDIGRVLLDFNSIPCPDSYITHLILWEQLWLPLRLLKHKPQMLHSPSPFIPLDHSIPSIITIHDLAIFLFPHIQVWKRRFQYKLLVNACAKSPIPRCRRSVFPSDTTIPADS
ncbi:hypothetical protein HY745_13005 [Candidatus Desantisbacteria bacterium]|nr:hypothetical protein [Candidatus Desantisbacteria bacterium]